MAPYLALFMQTPSTYLSYPDLPAQTACPNPAPSLPQAAQTRVQYAKERSRSLPLRCHDNMLQAHVAQAHACQGYSCPKRASQVAVAAVPDREEAARRCAAIKVRCAMITEALICPLGLDDRPLILANPNPSAGLHRLRRSLDLIVERLVDAHSRARHAPLTGVDLHCLLLGPFQPCAAPADTGPRVSVGRKAIISILRSGNVHASRRPAGADTVARHFRALPTSARHRDTSLRRCEEPADPRCADLAHIWLAADSRA